MIIGFLALALSVLSFSLVNITDKLVSTGNNNKTVSLLLRYISSIIASLTFIILGKENLVLPDFKYLIILVLSGMIAYGVNILMYRGLKHINTGSFFVIGYSYLIILFFVNIIIYGKSETLSLLKTIIAFIFIAYILYVTYVSGKKGNKNETLGYIFAIICAIGWALCFGIEGYMIKKNILSPFATIFYIYLGSILTSLILMIRSIIQTKNIVNQSSIKAYIAPIFGGILIATGSGSLLFSYKYIKLNIANILGVSEIFVTTILAIIILKEKHSKKEIKSIFFGFLLLSLFVSIK